VVQAKSLAGVCTMNPVTHFLTGWVIANADDLERRDRAIVTLAAIIPDVDGLGILTSLVSKDHEAGLHLYNQYHHVIAHNLFSGLLITAVAYALSKKKWFTALLVFFSFHLHLLGDLLSGRGPDGTIWSISYLYPAYPDFIVSWSGQWELNAWPNVAITGVLLLLTFYLAWKRGYSPVGIISSNADHVFVDTLRKRFGHPTSKN
jgi:inner membrane protein